MKRLLFFIAFLLFLLSFSNCYFNPVVNSHLNPAKAEETNPFLALLGVSGSGQTLTITGQIRDEFGVAQADLLLIEGSASANTKNVGTTYTTDSGGRFYIPYRTGTLNFEVLKNNSTYFNLILKVTDATTIASEVENGPAGIEISNLGSINASEPPSFFELVDVKVYYESLELPLHNQTLGISLGTIYLDFNQEPQLIESGNFLEWRTDALIFTPSPSTLPTAMSVSGNRMTLTGAEGIVWTKNTIDLKANIKSVSGLSLTPRKIKFCYENPCTL